MNNVQIGTVPVVSNQKVNVDSHVLSQDVDMHAPPIIFRNQDTNDIPITSGSYTNNNQHLQLANVFNRSHHEPNPYHHHESNPYHYEQNPYHHAPPVGNLIRDNNRSPFVVDIQGINLGMSNEDGESNISGEVNDDNSPLHSQAPQIINDQLHIDQHKEDDYENEHGEVIQESNSVPQLVSSDQTFSDNLNQIPDYAKPTTKSAHKDQRVPFTQTEANSLWHRYPSTTELYPITFTTDRPTVSPPPFQFQTTSANRLPLGTHKIKLQIPVVLPALVNDMYALPLNRTQTTKPIIPQHSVNHVNRIPNNKPVFFGYPPVEARPSKFGTPHHLTLQNLPVPPHFAGPLFTETHRPHPHHSRRPIQKPFSRYPVHHNKPIPTNYSVHQAESVKPNWQSSKPFDANNHFGLNTLLTTTRYPTSSVKDQTPQTSEINTLSTQRPFARPNNKPETGSKITHYTDPSTNITQAAQDLDIYDLSRGKPFVYIPQRSTSQESTANLNIGEEKRPMSGAKHTSANETVPKAEVTQPQGVFDHKEMDNSDNLPTFTENPNQIVTTDNLPGITNSVFIPFGEKLNEPFISSEQVYPKTPATEMQPPPTHATKYKPYIQKHVPAISPSPHHQNVLIEEVMGLHPPPVPKLSVKKQPSEIHGNYGKVSVAHSSLRPVHKQNTGIHAITAPTPHPVTQFVTHYESYSEADTELADVGPPQIVTSTQPDTDDSDANENVRIPYLNVMREKQNTRAPATNFRETTLVANDLNDYVRFSIDANPEEPTITTRKPFKHTSNGHMPQSPQFDEDSLLQPSQQHIFAEMTETSGVDGSTPMISTASFIQPTATFEAETVKATRHTIHDTKVLTVTTTKTTVHPQGITSTILLTLTRTKTSTIVDTVTHTFVKPTRVNHEPTIKPTIFTAPITMQKVSGSSASIVPNPSFSIYAIGSAHDESENDHDTSNVSSEEQSFEMDDIHEIQHMIRPTPKIPDHPSSKHVGSVNASNESIFVVMTDRKKLGTININADILNTLTSTMQNMSTKNGHDEKTSGTQKKSQATMGAIDDVSTDDEDFFDNLPKRDEDDIRNDVSHVLLGGILIATPPRSSEVLKKGGAKSSSKNSHPASYDINPTEEIDEHLESQGAAIIEETRTTHDKSRTQTQLDCQPDCKAVNNEVCQITGDLARCICRPGFARMFLDRPCKRKSFFFLH